jgi:hypothetical protein
MIAKFAAPGEIMAGSRAIFLQLCAQPSSNSICLWNAVRGVPRNRAMPRGSALSGHMARRVSRTARSSTCPVYPNRFTGNLVDKAAADALGVTLTLSRRPNETTIARTLRSTGSG